MSSLLGRLRPNKYNLDGEFEDNQDLVLQAQQEVAEQEEKWSTAVLMLDVRKSEISYLIRKGEFEDYTLPKTTEGSISDFLGHYPELKNLQQEVIEEKRKLVEAKGVMKAIDGRKSTIEGLLSLFNGGNYSEPNISEKDQREYVEVKQENEVPEKVKRRRRRVEKKDV